MTSYRITPLYGANAKRHTTIIAGDTTEAATIANERFPGSTHIEIHDEDGLLLEPVKPETLVSR